MNIVSYSMYCDDWFDRSDAGKNEREFFRLIKNVTGKGGFVCSQAEETRFFIDKTNGELQIASDNPQKHKTAIFRFIVSKYQKYKLYIDILIFRVYSYRILKLWSMRLICKKLWKKRNFFGKSNVL